ncbi:MAG: CRISPR-associated endonuclease Cas2 [Bacteroidota bacterium]|nr:CRISPR-associated endonuclease Cas2 [Bacteroidota bacterium]
MPRKKYSDLPFAQAVKIVKQATLQEAKPLQHKPIKDFENIESLQQRVDKILGIINDKKRKNTNMLFFVMYDIESDKVRNLVFKYLKKEGCISVQKSIFLGDTTAEKFNLIKENLSQVQACYDNSDSILIVPISTDYLKSMKIIGKQIDIDIIMKNKNTLFF